MYCPIYYTEKLEKDGKVTIYYIPWDTENVVSVTFTQHPLMSWKYELTATYKNGNLRNHDYCFEDVEKGRASFEKFKAVCGLN